MHSGFKTLCKNKSGEKKKQYCLLVLTKLRTYLIKTKLCIKIKLTQNATEKMGITVLEAKE